MKKIIFLAVTFFALYGCFSDESSEVVTPQPVEIQWSLSGTFGNATIDSINVDTELPEMINRTGTSTLHLDGFDTAYFEKKITLRHLQIGAGADVDIDDEGNFTFNNMEVFGLCENTNSIEIFPTVKENVNLNPSSVTLYSY